VQPYEPECLAAFDRALARLASLGADVSEFDIPVLAETADLTTRVIRFEAAAIHRAALAQSPEKFDVSLREQLLIGQGYTDDEMREAEAARSTLKQAYAELFANGIDVIASPGREGVADSMETLLRNSIRRRGSTTRMYNLAGLPALVMPMGFGREGLPLGIQFAAAPFAEDVIYQIAAAHEDATPDARRLPRLG
jgi:aspartyl-tRNA(Asn)/glutamyl-tRNA(Gln) amidotransferase subunit A